MGLVIMQQQQQNQLDQDVVNLAKAIRQVESGNKAVLPQEGAGFGGKSRYQYSNDTWKAVAGKYLGDPNAELNLQNENKATYMRIKDWKDQGKNIGQIASMWNAGEGEPDAYLGTFSNGAPAKGVNEYGVEYDVAAHAQKVRDAYRQMKGEVGGTYQAPPVPKPFEPVSSQIQPMPDQGPQPTGKEGGFLSDVGTSMKDLGTGIRSPWQEDQNLGSKALQTIGAVGKGIGDVTDDALTNLPVVGGGYEWITEKLGDAIGGASDATGLTQWFSEQSPEVQRNLEATLNAASIVPFLKAFSLGKQGITDTITAVTKGKMEQRAADEINKAMTTSKNRRVVDNAERRGMDPIGDIVRNPEYLPDRVNVDGRWTWDTTDASAAAQRNISAKEQALQNLLDSTTASQAAGIPLATVRSQVLKDVLGGRRSIANRRWENKINEIFDDIRYGYNSDYITLNDLNQIKRQVREAIDYDSPNPLRNPLRELDDEIQSSIRKQVEDYGKKVGIDDIAEINQEMARDITVKKVLDMLGDGKAIKSGAPGIGSALMNTATLGFARPLVDYRRAKQGPSTATSRLKGRRPLPETARKGLVRLGAGLALSGQLTSEE